MYRSRKFNRFSGRTVRPGQYFCFGMILLVGLHRPAPATAQPQEVVTITVQKGETVRDLAQKYYDDPNLWEEILKSNNMKSAAEIKPGMQLAISSGAVQAANRQLEEALQGIQKATEAGARYFVPDSISQSIDIYDQAVASRKSGDWKRSIQLATIAGVKAENARRETIAKRNLSGAAELTDRKGSVESRKPVEVIWINAPLLAKFIEGEMVRTLSSSFAEISFQDESRIRLNENSQAVIQRMRVDLLEKKKASQVSLVTGNAFALLQSNQKRKTFDLLIPGVSTKVNSKSFWVQKDEKSAKIANYEGELEVTSQGATVVLAENQGAVVEANKKPTRPAALLPSPALLSPEKNRRIYSGQTTFTWAAVEGARHYWLEVSPDETLQRMVISVNSLTATSFSTTLETEGPYYWRVAAIDANGFPSRFSDAGFFSVIVDKEAPFLQLDSPEDQVLVREPIVRVAGKSEKDAAVSLNGKLVQILADEAFQVDYPLRDGVNEITVEAKDLAGNVSRIQRTITYVSDARVMITYDPGLKQIRPKHFVIASADFTLSGKTTPRAALVLQKLPKAATMRTFADKNGVFQITINNLSGTEKLALSAVTPAGYSTQDTLVVEVDDIAPQIVLQAELPSLTANETLRLQGSAIGLASLQLNGRAISFRNDRFDETMQLLPGLNPIRLVASDLAGNVTIMEKQVTLDKEPPKLLDHKIFSLITGEVRQVNIFVRAQDESGLKRAAKCIIQAGTLQFTEYLILNPATQTYEDVAKLPKESPEPLKLKSVILEDYLGNQKEYQVN
jgi:hypothetical protein